MHSAKPLPSATHGIPHMATKDSAKPSLLSVFYPALSKDFAACPDGSRPKKSKGHGQMMVTAHLPSAVMGRHSAKME